MPAGFVYVLLNPSFVDMVKIGLTEDNAELRARKLWSTGVPTPFIVVYDELVSDCQEVERRLHQRFASSRVHDNREFFRIPVRDAIKALQQEAQGYPVSTQALAKRRSIRNELLRKYPGYLRADIAEVAIVQPPGVCFLEITRRLDGGLRDEIVERVDLGFIAHGDTPMFPVDAPIEDNAKRFVSELDEYSIIHTTHCFPTRPPIKSPKSGSGPGASSTN
jgi:hypothetical protein